MPPIPTNAALIIIDVQQAFDDASWGRRNNLGAEVAIAEMIDAWRASSRPLFHVHHRSASPQGLFRPVFLGPTRSDAL
jgi:nicotinamidase-related amidase